MRVRSLRGDLTLGLGLGLTLLWLLAMLGAWLILREEMAEVYDSLMIETADRLLPLTHDRPEDDPAADRAGRAGDEALLTWVLRDAGGAVVRRSGGAADAVFAVAPAEGFSTIGDYRHFLRIEGGLGLNVASPLQERREAARGILLSLLVPALVLLPLSLIGIAWFTRRSFRGVTALSLEVAGRAPDDLRPLATPGLQAELLPIRDAVDRLMSSLNAALAAERAFSANAAHELRTPIAATLAHVQRLLAETPDGPVHDRARTIEAELRRVTRLVEKLLHLARAESTPRTEQAIDAVPILQMVAGDLDVPLAVPETAVPVWIDADALAILARNLVENAVVHGRDARVLLSADGWLRVVNAGPVVAPGALPDLTRRFERAGSVGPGSGLGLAIVAAICRSYGLDLGLSSPAQGQPDGFEAWLRLPVERLPRQGQRGRGAPPAGGADAGPA